MSGIVRTGLKIYNLDEVDSTETALNWVDNIFSKHYTSSHCYVSYLEADKQGDHSFWFSSIKDMKDFILNNDKEPYNINIECTEVNFAFLINIFSSLIYLIYGEEINLDEIKDKLNLGREREKSLVV